MQLLAGTHYDPAAAVSQACGSLLAMTALDTTNLRLTFAAPTNGAVLVRERGVIHQQTTYAQILLGVLDGATVRGRQVPMGSLKTTAVATAQLTQEALFLVTGLTPGAAYTWDAAYGVEIVIATSGLKYGGPNDTVGNDAFGGFVFEIYDTPNLLAGVNYDPSTAAGPVTTGLTVMTAVDTTNLRLNFTVPPSGTVGVRLRTCVTGATTMPSILLGVLEGATVRGRQSPIGGIPGTALATTRIPQEATFVVTGLTPGAALTWDAAYAVQVLLAATNIKYGGPNNTTTNDAWGGFSFEVWKIN